MIAGYASDIDTNETIDSYLKSREGKEIESSFKMDVDGSGKRKNVVEKEGYYYVVEEDENGNYKVEKLTDEQIGEKLEILTSENFDGNGEMTFNPGKDNKQTLVFGDEIKEGEFCFDIQSGEVTIYIDYDMNLTNQGLTRSAINIEPEAKLNLYVDEGVTLTVNSGLGEKGDENDYMKVNQGGYAGIRVPFGAILALRGSGTLVAYGGDAGDGNAYVDDGSNLGGSGGGRSWSRNRTEIGGVGAGYAIGKGANGGDGENCGTILIYDDFTVYAYGGAGGSGADGTLENGSGGGGYPRSWNWSEVGARSSRRYLLCWRRRILWRRWRWKYRI